MSRAKCLGRLGGGPARPRWHNARRAKTARSRGRNRRGAAEETGRFAIVRFVARFIMRFTQRNALFGRNQITSEMRLAHFRDVVRAEGEAREP